MSPLSIARRLRRAALAAALLGVTMALAGCEQVAIITSAPVQASYDTHRGNNPVAANDARLLQQALTQAGQLWTLRFDTEPASAESVAVDSQQAVVGARGKVTKLVLTLTATAQSTLDGFSARGAAGEQNYTEALLRTIAGAGYIHITSARVEVYYKASHHATLTYSQATGFTYKLLDNQP
jgi:hypothetical protein